MKAASGLDTGEQPVAEIARDAVQQALDKAGLERADHVVLFLSRDFARNPQPALLAAARAAGTLSICGSTAYGLMTENSWQLDQAAAAALVIAASEQAVPDATPLLSFSSQPRFPGDWLADHPRAGFVDSDGCVWSHGRVAGEGCAEFRLPASIFSQARSSGLRLLSGPLGVDQSRGFDLLRLGGQTAKDSLLRALPPEHRQKPPLHQIMLLRHPDEPGIAILSVNPDGSLSLADNIAHDTTLTWAIRQPLTAEQQMRESLRSIASRNSRPAFALMFSCIGRGPLFYGNDDRDLQAFREAFPGTPLLGAYGTSQIIPHIGRNHLHHNAALTLLFESTHV